MTSQDNLLQELVDPAPFREILRAIVGSVSIVAAGQGPDKRGLTVTAASSLSVAPPMVLACINRSAEAHDIILKTGAFSWNVLSVDDKALAERFAAMDGSKGASRFASEVWSELATGSPILLSSVCSFDCKVQGILEAGTHTVVTGAVVAQTSDAGRAPLIYSSGKFGRIVHYE